MRAKKYLGVLLCLTMLFSFNVTSVSAASKKYVKSMKVSKSAVTLNTGDKTTVNVTVKVAGKAKAGVKVKNTSKSVIAVKVGKTQKGKTAITITAKNTGNAKVTVTTKGRKKNKKVIKKTIQVNVVGNDNSTNKNPSGTNNNQTSGGTNNNQNNQKPSGTGNGQNNQGTTGADNDNSTSVSNVVNWTTTSETFTGYYSRKNETTGNTDIIPKELTRKYVSFSPWPTTNEQVEYVIKNCDDPFVIGALYIVALDNFEYNGLGNYNGEVYKMLNTLMSGAGTVSGSNYQLSNYAKQQICGFGQKQIVADDGTAINASTFASRAYLKGATPYNNYTPDGGMNDKTKWKIVMDEYVYCGDLDNGYITVCPQRYTEEKETESSTPTHVEHWQGIRIGMRWNKSAQVWLPTDNVSLNTPPTGALVPFNVEKQVLFSSNYMAPKIDQGW